MQSYFLSFLYLVAVILLLWQAFRVMFRSLPLVDQFSKNPKAAASDRTGRVTIHPELLNKEGQITDEDLLTVRFSKDFDPPTSSERSSE